MSRKIFTQTGELLQVNKMGKINSPTKRRITEALDDHFSFSDQLMREIVETVCLIIEEVTEEGIKLTKIV